MSNNLSVAELLKYDWRIKVFLKKYEHEEPMEFVTGPKKSLVYSEKVARLIEKKEASQLQGLILVGRNKKPYAISDLKRTQDFNDFTGIHIEAKEIQSTSKQIQNAKTQLQSGIVPIRIGSDTYDISTIQKTPGNLKSDFHLLDNQGHELVWISHKDGKRAIDFQQWSGMTENAILNEEEIKDFIEAVKLVYPLGIDKGVTVARKIKNRDLKMKSVYGPKFGGAFGQQNVTIVMQGPIDIQAQGKHYKLCSNHILINGDDPRDDYEPVMMAIYKGDRSQFDVKGARFTIQPIGSRKINDFI